MEGQEHKGITEALLIVASYALELQNFYEWADVRVAKLQQRLKEITLKEGIMNDTEDVQVQLTDEQLREEVMVEWQRQNKDKASEEAKRIEEEAKELQPLQSVNETFEEDTQEHTEPDEILELNEDTTSSLPPKKRRKFMTANNNEATSSLPPIKKRKFITAENNELTSSLPSKKRRKFITAENEVTSSLPLKKRGKFITAENNEATSSLPPKKRRKFIIAENNETTSTVSPKKLRYFLTESNQITSMVPPKKRRPFLTANNKRAARPQGAPAYTSDDSSEGETDISYKTGDK